MQYGSEYHIPVMPDEVLSFLVNNRDGLFIDGTSGGGGHSEAILNTLNSAGRVLGLDVDPDALAFSQNRLASYGQRFQAVEANFRNVAAVVADLGVAGIDGILLDLGVSSHQIDDAARGFSFQLPADLDMRMSVNQKVTAADIVNQYTERELADLFFRYGEERLSRKIAGRIVAKRQQVPITTSGQLKEIVISSVPFTQQVKSLARIFQALRIAVNDELESLRQCLADVVDCLLPGGRIVVLSYHSLEDRIVKEFFRNEAPHCICPRSFPQCVCGQPGRLKILTRKIVKPGEAEVAENARARSARLRAAEKLSKNR